jgi:very-short-patch-repair endonuclease
MKRIYNTLDLGERRKYLRNHATDQELILWSKLKGRQLGVKFRRQHSIAGYIVDFYCPSKKLVIEIDGSQHLLIENEEYDKKRTIFFSGLGIYVLRFTNLEINMNLKGVLLDIESKIQDHP